MASTGGRELFFVSALSHEASNKTAAPKIPMLESLTLKLHAANLSSQFGITRL